jgi:hypothetical protein
LLAGLIAIHIKAVHRPGGVHHCPRNVILDAHDVAFLDDGDPIE